MKNLTLEECETRLRDVAVDVVAVGEMYRVDCGSPGAFVIMEEPEFLVLRDAMAAMMHIATNGKLPDEFQQLLKSKNGRGCAL